MPTLAQLGQVGHAAAAVLFAVLAVWQAHRNREWARLQVALTLALSITGIWALLSAFVGPVATVTVLAETLRNGGWLFFMYCLLCGGETRDHPRTVTMIYIVLSMVLAAQFTVDIVIAQLSPATITELALDYGSYMPRMIFSVGALLLVHNLYTIASTDARWRIALPLAALAAMWTYDLNLYTIAYLTRILANELIGLRGFAIMTLAPIFVMALLRTRSWQISLSRSAAFQSVSLSVIGAYLITMFMAANAIQYIGGDYVALAQVTLIFFMCIVALLVIPSGGFRSWLRVQVSKHFFKHRYDYRAEWMRFTETMGQPGPDALPFDARIIQAIANISRSDGGLLLVADRDGNLRLKSRWNWEEISVPALAKDDPFAALLRDQGYIVELDSVRNGGDSRARAEHVPAWLMESARAWAVIPLIHFGRLVGIAVLSAPENSRRMDWEDLDMFRVVGRQVGSYLAEWSNQQALLEARQFDNLNRRFAFIVHDIKNVVSQLSLLSRNAERHADNPEFRRDMIDTLQISVEKMNELLARLSQHNKGRTSPSRAIDLNALVGQLADSRRALHPIMTDLKLDQPVQADPERIGTILSHLIQNASEASDRDAAIEICTRQSGHKAIVEIIDHGCGMDEAFMREELFRPFSSTKEGGFGIGAFEAMTLAQSLGGRLDVESRSGVGTRFTLTLPLARDLPATLQERAA